MTLSGLDPITLYGYSIDPLIIVGGMLVVVLVLVGIAKVYKILYGADEDEESLKDISADLVDESEGVPDGGHVVELQLPNIRSARFGMLGVMWRSWRNYRKRKKVGEDGYIEWYLVDDAWPVPKFIKPETEGGGVPEYEYNGKTYLFPRQGRVPNTESGMWTVVHSKGDAIPINLDVTGQPSLDPQALNEYSTMRPSSSPPSILDKFDVDPQTLLMGGIAVLLVLTGVSQFF